LQLDEGNPLVCGDELAGIVSRSPECGANLRPSVYTEVHKYSDWVEWAIESMKSAAVSTLSSFVTLAMPVGLLSYWKCIE
jgi:secreted trypsin-like serine protease